MWMCLPDVDTEPPAASVWPGVSGAGARQLPPTHCSSPRHGMVTLHGTCAHFIMRQTPTAGGQSLDLVQFIPLDGTHIPAVQVSPAMHAIVCEHGTCAHIPLRQTVWFMQSVEVEQGVPCGAVVWQPATSAAATIDCQIRLVMFVLRYVPGRAYGRRSAESTLVVSIARSQSREGVTFARCVPSRSLASRWRRAETPARRSR